LAVLVIGCRQAFPVDFPGFDFVQDAVDRQFVPVVLVDCSVDLGFAGQQGFDLGALFQQRTDPVEADNVVDVGNRQGQALARQVVVEREQVIAFGEFPRDELEGLRVDDRMGQVDALLAQAFRQRLAQGRFGNETQ